MTTDIQKRDEQALSPEVFGQQIAWAHEKARLLKTIVDSQKLSVKIGPSEHLRFEAWQTIARGYGSSCSTSIVELLYDQDGTVIGAKAHASIIDDATGMIVGGAENYCFAAEEGKGQQTVAQLCGMAQTRAAVRAFKEKFSWVVVLAGYDPTPAEEMVGILAKERAAIPSKGTNGGESSNLCPLHKTEWFKRGAMKAYGHPIQGQINPKTGKNNWCMKADVKADTTPSKSHQDSQGGASEPEEVIGQGETPQKASFEHLGELMDRINKAYQLTTNQVLDILGVEHLGEIREHYPNLDIAWEKIVDAPKGRAGKGVV